MKLSLTLTAALVSLTLVASLAAQPPERERPRGEGARERGREGQRPEGREGGRPGPRGEGGPRRGPGGPPNPVLEALDANGDREISAEEIKNAAAALAKLDKNKDGKLTMDEIRPQFDGRRGGPGEGRRPEGAEGGPRRGGGPRGAGGFNPEQFVARVMEFDKNKDGKVSKDELPERMHSMLTRADANKDDALDKKELTAAAARFRGGAGDRRPQGEGERPRRPSRPERE